MSLLFLDRRSRDLKCNGKVDLGPRWFLRLEFAALQTQSYMGYLECLQERHSRRILTKVSIEASVTLVGKAFPTNVDAQKTQNGIFTPRQPREDSAKIC
jgi:hypothetical protein